MKYFFTLVFASLFYLTNAQTYPWLNNFYAEIPGQQELLDSAIAANNYHSKTRVFTRFNKKGASRKDQEIAVFKYDDKGFLTVYEETHTKSKKSEKYEYFYKDSLLSSYNHYKNNKLVKRYEIAWYKSNKVSDVIKKNGKNTVVMKQHNDYNENLNLSKTAVYDKNGKEKKAIEYTYYDAKAMKQAKEYRKGKLKKIWNYTCDPAGVKEEKVKEMKICKNVNVDENGNRVETNRIVNPKGEVELRVNTFDKNDRMIKQLVYDDVKHKLKSEWSYAPLNDKWEMLYIAYDKKGRQNYYNKAIFNSWQRILSNEYVMGRKKKSTFRTSFEYNDKHLMTHFESFDSKNRKRSENIHTYN